MTFNDEQSEKVIRPIAVVVVGICIDSNDVHESNASSPIVCKPFGSLIDFNERQCSNA